MDLLPVEFIFHLGKRPKFLYVDTRQGFYCLPFTPSIELSCGMLTPWNTRFCRHTFVVTQVTSGMKWPTNWPKRQQDTLIMIDDSDASCDSCDYGYYCGGPDFCRCVCHTTSNYMVNLDVPIHGFADLMKLLTL